MRRNTVLALAVVLLVLVAMAAKSLLVSVPPLRTQNSAGAFDAARAKARLAAVLGDQRPHPADSEANDAVRDRLIAELKTMGLTPIVRDQRACNDFQKARLVACARVRNVLALLGPPSGRAVLLNAHYDSVPVGPGAGDDGVGVATLLEVAENLRHRQLRRPVILLFNEGEELGLVGARAFVTDPLSRNVDSLLNFEARGVTGPVTMFETSQPNGPAVAAFASAVQRPFASSLMTDVYRLMPNDTDVTTFRDRGWLTLNFAMTGNETRYHSPGDDLAALDVRSLQHMGDQALALTSRLASGETPQTGPQRIFIDILGRGLVQMPLVGGLILFVALLVSFLFLVFQRRAYGRALIAVVTAFIGAGAAGWLATLLLGALKAGTYWRAHPEFTFLAIYAAALLAIVTALKTIAGRAEARQQRVAFWALFLVLGGALAIAAPGAIIYFLGPPLAALIGIAASRWVRWAEVAGAVLGLFLLYVSWGEMLALLEELFSPGPLWIVAPVAALLMIAALVEADALVKPAGARTLLLGTSLVAVIAMAAALARPAYSADRQQRFTIEHITSFPDGKSQWSLLNDGAPLPAAVERVGDWQRGKLAFSARKRWLAPAPAIQGMQAPSLERLETIDHGTERLLRLRLHTDGADRLLLVVPEEGRVRSAGFTGSTRELDDDDSSGEFTITCTGRSCDGAELMIDQGTSKATTWTIVASRNGLPASAQPLLRARPPFARPQYVPDETVAVARVRI